MLRHRLHHQKGSAAIEFALVLSLLLSITGFAVDFGLAFFASHISQNAAREGARLAVTQIGLVEGSLAAVPGVHDRVKAVIPAIPLFANFLGGITSTLNANCEVEVRVAGTSPYLFLQLLPGVPESIQIERKVSMRYEHCNLNSGAG